MRIPIFLAAVAAALVGGASGAERPNVVVILADDLGWSDLACYGSDLHETPHLDRLASQGVRFTDAYAASPVCTPTRASLLTGRHPARLQMTIWREAAADRGDRRLLEPVVRGDLPLVETTLAELLHDAGYYTAHVGKWHLGRAEAYPQPHGFDVNVGGTLWGAPQTFFYPFRGDQYFRDWRYVPDLEPSEPGDYLTDRLTDEAIKIVDRMGERPFYLNLWYHAVHTPIEGPPELTAKYEAKYKANASTDGVHRNPHYAAMVERLDANVGRVLAKLDDAGVADRTIVLFASDNGGFVGDCKLHPGLPVTSNAPLRSGKGSLYEGGIRVPLIVRAPGVTPAGAVCREPVVSCDLLPTVLSLVGLAAPNDLILDGVNGAALLSDPGAHLPDRSLYFHYPHYYPTTTPASAIRSGRWKLLEYFEDDTLELYDLATDLGEHHNLAPARPDLAARLQAELAAWREDVGAPMPEVNGVR